MSAQTHQSDPRILNRRTLERDHRHLHALLRPGLSVMDVGCGTGAITAGIALAVGKNGSVVGVDRDATLLAVGRQDHVGFPNLTLVEGDALDLGMESRFDVVNAARVLQWIGEPGRAIAQMKLATKPGGMVVALDYDHAKNSWEPVPPAEFQRFYRAFLDWREANGWDNRIAEHLPGLFEEAGLADIRVCPADETVQRGDAEFAEGASLWPRVIQTLGPNIVSCGFLSEADRVEAERVYDDWAENRLQRQRLSMKAVLGRKGRE